MKDSHVVVVADGTRARLFILSLDADDGSQLGEVEVLVNPEHRAHDRDKFSDARPGSTPAPGGGRSHGFDDHRAGHDREHEQGFARDIIKHALALAGSRRAGHLVLAAEKRMLGRLRGALELPAHSGIEVSDVAGDLTRLTPERIHEHLANDGLLPQRRAPQG